MYALLWAVATGCGLPAAPSGGSAGRLHALGCGVPPHRGSPAVPGWLAPGSRDKGWGLLWGMELTLGNISVPFHNSTEKRVGVRACLTRGLLPTPRTRAEPQSPESPFPCAWAGPEGAAQGAEGARDTRCAGGCSCPRRVAEGRCRERRKASLLAASVLFSASAIGAAPLGDWRLFCWGWLHSSSLFIAAVSAAVASVNKQDLKLPSSREGW